MLDNLEIQARIFFFLSYLKDHRDATPDEALGFSEKCWREFVVETRKSWLEDIRDLLHHRGTPEPNALRPRLPRERSAQYTGV